MTPFALYSDDQLLPTDASLQSLVLNSANADKIMGYPDAKDTLELKILFFSKGTIAKLENWNDKIYSEARRVVPVSYLKKVRGPDKKTTVISCFGMDVNGAYELYCEKLEERQEGFHFRLRVPWASLGYPHSQAEQYSLFNIMKKVEKEAKASLRKMPTPILVSAVFAAIDLEKLFDYAVSTTLTAQAG